MQGKLNVNIWSCVVTHLLRGGATSSGNAGNGASFMSAGAASQDDCEESRRGVLEKGICQSGCSRGQMRMERGMGVCARGRG